MNVVLQNFDFTKFSRTAWNESETNRFKSNDKRLLKLNEHSRFDIPHP